MKIRMIIVAGVILLCLGGCSMDFPELPALDDPTRRLTSSFGAVSLEEFLALDEDVRAKRRDFADDQLAVVRHFEKNRSQWVREEMRLLRTADINSIVIRDPRYRYDQLMRHLYLAVDVDPSHMQAWYRLGSYARDLGDYEQARRAYGMVRTAAPHDASMSRPGYMVAMAGLKEAWCCRELGYVDEGLALVGSIREESGLDNLESKILHGLLLADAGRFQEAYDLSMSLEAVEIPDISSTHRGQRKIQSNYVRCWIQAMAWRGIGEPRMARHALGELRFHRVAFPFKREYWNDVGLVCELNGSISDSKLAYGLSVSTKRHLVPFINWDAFSTPPVIFDQPHIQIPSFTAYDSRLLGGSLFTLGAQLLAECAQAEGDSLRDLRGAAAVEALTVCMRRNIRPTLAQALRGRARYYIRDLEAAEQDLRTARTRLQAEGLGDVGTELVLGTILVNDKRSEEALEFLNAAVGLDPGLAGAWRTLGVAHATLGRNDEAEAAFDEALDLDPESSLGWHNRGLFHASLERWAPAMTDLGVAVRLAPWNTEARDLLQRVTLEMRDANAGEAALRATARADSLAGSIPAYAEGRLEDRPAVIALGEPAERARVATELPDFDAVADSLAAVYAADPSAENRRLLADACLHAGRTDQVQALMGAVPAAELASRDLVLMLRADREAGDASRARALVGGIGGPQDPDDADLWSLVALICLDNALEDEGRRALDRALELDPGNKGLQAYRQFLGQKKDS